MKSIAIVVSIAGLAISLAGCGGGSNGGGATTTPQNISGQAAIGSPLSYATVRIKSLVDGTSQTYTTLADGTFTVQPGAVTYPAVVTAISQDGRHTNYGYIQSATQTSVAVNPITTSQLTLASQASPATLSAPLTTTQISNGQTQVLTVLGNVMSAVTGVNTAQSFLTQTFATNHTGLDQVLDSVGITLQPTGDLTVTNKIGGTRQTVTPATPSTITAIPFTANSAIQSDINTCSTFLSGLTSSNIAAATNYDPAFLDNGRDAVAFGAYMSQIATNTGVSYKLTSPIFSGLDANNNYLFDVTIGNETTPVDGVPFITKVSGGNCVLVGNQFPWEITVQPKITQVLRVDGTTGNQISTPARGIEVWLGGNTYQTLTFNSARVDICDSSNNCNLLTTLSSSSGQLMVDAGVGVYPTVNLVPNPAFNILSDNLNPVRITFYSSATAPTNPTDFTNQIGPTFKTRVDAAAFTDAEFASISASMPSITNAAQILQNVISNPTLDFNSGSSSTIISGVDYRSADNGNTNVNEGFALILNSGSFSKSITWADVASPVYKKLALNAHVDGRIGIVDVVYLWAPNCQGCY